MKKSFNILTLSRTIFIGFFSVVFFAGTTTPQTMAAISTPAPQKESLESESFSQEELDALAILKQLGQAAATSKQSSDDDDSDELDDASDDVPTKSLPSKPTSTPIEQAQNRSLPPSEQKDTTTNATKEDEEFEQFLKLLLGNVPPTTEQQSQYLPTARPFDAEPTKSAAVGKTAANSATEPVEKNAPANTRALLTSLEQLKKIVAEITQLKNNSFFEPAFKEELTPFIQGYAPKTNTTTLTTINEPKQENFDVWGTPKKSIQKEELVPAISYKTYGLAGLFALIRQIESISTYQHIIGDQSYLPVRLLIDDNINHLYDLKHDINDLEKKLKSISKPKSEKDILNEYRKTKGTKTIIAIPTHLKSFKTDIEKRYKEFFTTNLPSISQKLEEIISSPRAQEAIAKERKEQQAREEEAKRRSSAAYDRGWSRGDTSRDSYGRGGWGDYSPRYPYGADYNYGRSYYPYGDDTPKDDQGSTTSGQDTAKGQPHLYTKDRTNEDKKRELEKSTVTELFSQATTLIKNICDKFSSSTPLTSNLFPQALNDANKADQISELNLILTELTKHSLNSNEYERSLTTMEEDKAANEEDTRAIQTNTQKTISKFDTRAEAKAGLAFFQTFIKTAPILIRLCKFGILPQEPQEWVQTQKEICSAYARAQATLPSTKKAELQKIATELARKIEAELDGAFKDSIQILSAISSFKYDLASLEKSILDFSTNDVDTVDNQLNNEIHRVLVSAKNPPYPFTIKMSNEAREMLDAYRFFARGKYSDNLAKALPANITEQQVIALANDPEIKTIIGSSGLQPDEYIRTVGQNLRENISQERWASFLALKQAEYTERIAKEGHINKPFPQKKLEELHSQAVKAERLHRMNILRTMVQTINTMLPAEAASPIEILEAVEGRGIKLANNNPIFTLPESCDVKTGYWQIRADEFLEPNAPHSKPVLDDNENDYNRIVREKGGATPLVSAAPNGDGFESAKEDLPDDKTPASSSDEEKEAHTVPATTALNTTIPQRLTDQAFSEFICKNNYSEQEAKSNTTNDQQILFIRYKINGKIYAKLFVQKANAAPEDTDSNDDARSVASTPSEK